MKGTAEKRVYRLFEGNNEVRSDETSDYRMGRVVPISGYQLVSGGICPSSHW